MKNCCQKQKMSLGAVHIHSKFSDGTGDIDSITRAAKAAGLDWIVVTDHNNFDIPEGFINDVCVIRGEEISPENNHYLALGIRELIGCGMPTEKYVQEVRAQGGFGFAAHPDESGARKNDNRPIRWLDKSVKPDGVEIWNWFSTWANNYSNKNIFTLAWAYLFKHSLITKACPETLAWWDKLNNESGEIVPAIGGVDAHALKVNKYIIPVTIFPYKEMFETICVAIEGMNAEKLDYEGFRAYVLEALREGRSLIVNRKVCSHIPEISIENTSQKAYCGESIECDNSTYMNIRLARKFEVRILRDGEVVFSDWAKVLEFPITKKGKYRVEIGLKKLGFAYSNPIVVK